MMPGRSFEGQLSCRASGNRLLAPPTPCDQTDPAPRGRDDLPGDSRPGEHRVARWRPTAVKLHRWLGLSIGIPFAVLAGTGAVMVYEDQLDELVFGPAAPETTPGRVPVDVAIATAQEARPDADLDEVMFPPARDEANVYHVVLRQGPFIFDEYIDAGSGERVFWRGHHPALRLVETLHVSLALGSWGYRLTQFTTIVGLPMLLLGLWVWWPRGGRWRNGFRVDWRRGAYRLNWDLHKVAGILAFPALLVLTLTGVLIFYPSVPNTAGDILQGPAPTFAVESTPSAGAEAVARPLEDAVLAAMDEVGGSVVVMHPGAEASAPVELEMEVEGRTVVAAVDRYRAEVLATRDGGGLRLDSELVDRVHAAELDSEILRGLLSVGSLVGALLLATGLFTWVVRGRRERARAAAKES